MVLLHPCLLFIKMTYLCGFWTWSGAISPAFNNKPDRQVRWLCFLMIFAPFPPYLCSIPIGMHACMYVCMSCMYAQKIFNPLFQYQFVYPFFCQRFSQITLLGKICILLKIWNIFLQATNLLKIIILLHLNIIASYFHHFRFFLPESQIVFLQFSWPDANFFLGKEYTDIRAIAITQSFSVVDPQTQKPKVLTLENNLPQFATFQTDRGGGQNQSQTTGCHSYRFETADAIFTFIDTPGFGDTNGTDQDRENVKEIAKAVVQKTEVHAIALVHKGSDCKNDPFSKYCISEIKTMMPIECRENFVVCFTCAVNAAQELVFFANTPNWVSSRMIWKLQPRGGRWFFRRGDITLTLPPNQPPLYLGDLGSRN